MTMFIETREVGLVDLLQAWRALHVIYADVVGDLWSPHANADFLLTLAFPPTCLSASCRRPQQAAKARSVAVHMDGDALSNA